MRGVGREEGNIGGTVVCVCGSMGMAGLGTGSSVPFGWLRLFGDEAVGEEAVVLVVAEDVVIEEIDVEDVAGLD